MDCLNHRYLWEYQAPQGDKWSSWCNTPNECRKDQHLSAWWSQWWWYQCQMSLLSYTSKVEVLNTKQKTDMWWAVKCQPVRVVPPVGEGFTDISSHLRQAQSSRSIKLTPAKDLTVWSRYLCERTSSSLALQKKVKRSRYSRWLIV